MEHHYSLSVEDLGGDNDEEVEVGNMPQEECEIPESPKHDNVEVQSVNSIIDELEKKLAVGTLMNSVEDAYLLYCQYAYAKGFSVRKGDQRYFPRSSELQMKEFKCSCEGLKDEKHSYKKVPVYQKTITRTDCKAKLKIAREKEGDWKVSKFVMEHNHEMLASGQTHLLRSSRNISHAKKSALEALVSAGIPIASAVSFMENEAHGRQNLGFTRKDAYDHFNRLQRHTKVENGDATALLKYFINKSNKENHFYYNLQLDDEGRIMNFFFRDHRCAINYEYFGDVLSIDTTYRTNKYNLICAPFVGINHHMNNVMFGLAFMSDETESSFEWLFTTFLDSMNGKQPQVIFSDQCQAMMNAIETIFPRAHHRLCQWHINQNAPSHFGSLNGDSKFKKLWQNCMSRCESEEEFEATWKHMIDEYNLGDHKWLNGMYKLRRKWATVFSNDKFSAGLSATSRSEVTNRVLKDLGDRTITLYQFVKNYEKMQDRWRRDENDEDSRCCHQMASLAVKYNPLLTNAAGVYTLNAYNTFEREFLDCLNIVFVEQSDFGNGWVEFKVRSHGESSKVRSVVFHRQSHDIKCSCHQFETTGILCKHALRVFNVMNVTVLPKSCILQRWTKNVINRVFNKVEESGSGSGSGYISEMVFVNQAMRSSYDLVHLSKSHHEARSMLTGILDGARQQISTLVKNLSIDNSCDDLAVGKDDDQIDEVQIRNPQTAKARGITNACITRHWDDKGKKGKGKGKGKAASSNAKEYKMKVQSSQDDTNSQQASFVSPQQYPAFSPPQYPIFPPQQHSRQPPSFASQIDANQAHWRCPNQGGGSGNIFLGGQNILFGYPFGTPHPSQGHSESSSDAR